jgi:HSP20 family molecular chaperone IbpA
MHHKLNMMNRDFQSLVQRYSHLVEDEEDVPQDAPAWLQQALPRRKSRKLAAAKQQRQKTPNMFKVRFSQPHTPMDNRKAEALNVRNPVHMDRDGNRAIQLYIDLRQFKPEEISVKTKDDHLEISAKHKDENEHGWVTREYFRAFPLPQEVNREEVSSVLSPEGILIVEAMLKPAQSMSVTGQEGAKTLPITHEGGKK